MQVLSDAQWAKFEAAIFAVKLRKARPRKEDRRTIEAIIWRLDNLAPAIRYALNHWKGLVLFLDDGRLELDTNTVERAMRPVALGRKNALFAGADRGGRHWAILASLIQTAKLNDVDPLALLTDVLERIVSGRTKRNELHRLLPWSWAAPNPGGVNSE
jgi:transposase